MVVVFSDGGQTAGRVTPQQAAAAASRAKIPVSTVALGTPDGVVLQKLQGGFTERIQVPVQPQVLQGIARVSGGTFTQGAQNVDVKRTYSELGSRMTAMESATKKAAEMIGKYTLIYNRARQAQITKEIAEVIGGAEALK